MSHCSSCLEFGHVESVCPTRYIIVMKSCQDSHTIKIFYAVRPQDVAALYKQQSAWGTIAAKHSNISKYLTVYVEEVQSDCGGKFNIESILIASGSEQRVFVEDELLSTMNDEVQEFTKSAVSALQDNFGPGYLTGIENPSVNKLKWSAMSSWLLNMAAYCKTNEELVAIPTFIERAEMFFT